MREGKMREMGQRGVVGETEDEGRRDIRSGR